jgi:hypothetical protein
MFETREELLRHLVIYDLLRSSILFKNKVKINYYDKTHTF